MENPFTIKSKLELRLLLLFLLSFYATTIYAQVTQSGVVMEYRGQQQKTPLAQVELRVIGAGSTVSGVQGMFQLKFRTLKAGDKVAVRGIEKVGYEIFNREAVDQWHISRSDRPFLIVMCRTENFRKIREGYEKVASKSYEHQLKRDEDILAQQRRKNKMSQQKYEAELEKLRNDYEDRLEHLDSYIDRFARIDLSELSETENRIIRMVQEGKIDEAVKAYDALGLEEKYHEQEKAVARTQSAIDRLSSQHAQSIEERNQAFAAIRRKNDLLYMAGGNDNIAKIGVSLKRVAEADTTYYPALEEYALYLIEQMKPQEALSWLRMAERHADNDAERINAKLGQATAYVMAGNYDDAVKRFDASIEDVNKTYKGKDEILLLMQRVVLEQLAAMYTMQCQYQDARDCWTQDVNLLEQLVTLVPDDFDEDLANGLCYLAHVEMMLGHSSEALQHAQKSVEIYERLCKRDMKKFELALASARHTLAEQYYQLRKNDQALNLMNAALPVVERYYLANPRKQLGLMADCVKLHCSILRTAKRYDEAERQLKHALELNEQLMTAMPNQSLFRLIKANYMVSLGWILDGQGKFAKAEQTFRQAISLMQQLDDGIVNHHYEQRAYYGLGNTAVKQGKLQDALPYFQKSLAVVERVYRETPAVIVNDYHLSLYAMSSVHFYLGHVDEALSYANRDLTLMKKHQGVIFDHPENSAIMGASISQQRQQYNKALDYAEQILQFVPSGVMRAAYIGFKGELFSKLGRQREARKLYEQALQLANDYDQQMPRNLLNLDTKGELLMRLGRRDEAKKVWQRILVIEPQYVQKNGQQSGFYQLLKAYE